MPFPKQALRAFTRQNIEAVTPGQTGVYGLFRDSTWVYVGKGDVRERLLAHLDGDNPCITRQRPTHWVGELVNGDPTKREKELILECSPSCNVRVG
jgi:hypothetical protein